MSDKELKELMSIICEGQDSEQRRKVENFIEYQVQLIDSLDKEIERQKEIIRQLDIKNLELITILKEVRELRNKISNLYYEEGYELDTPMLLKYIDEILDKVDKENNND